RAPRSTPFPYTTLFRSDGSNSQRQIIHAPAHSARGFGSGHASVRNRLEVSRKVNRRGSHSLERDDRVEEGAVTRHCHDSEAGGADRKSTRLNSSHLVIS